MSANGIEAPAGASGARIVTADEARAWWNATDPIGLGMMADEARRKRHGDRVTYVRVFDVPSADAQSALAPAEAGEIRVTGVPPEVGEACSGVASLVGRAGGIPVTAFTLNEIEQVTGGGAALGHYLRALADVGLAGVAEVQLDAPLAVRAALDALTDAGLHAVRFTVRQVPADVPQLLLDVRQLQKATGAMHSFAPLPRVQDVSAPTTGYQDVKAVALARMVLDNVSSIQVDWTLYGPKLAQVALLFGADDVDAVSPLDESGQGRRRAPREEVRRNVLAASLRPVERDGRFAVRE